MCARWRTGRRRRGSSRRIRPTSGALRSIPTGDGSRPWTCPAASGSGRRPRDPSNHDVAFEPSGRWVATANSQELALWPLRKPYPRSVGRPRVVGGRRGVHAGRVLARVRLGRGRRHAARGPCRSRASSVDASCSRRGWMAPGLPSIPERNGWPSRRTVATSSSCLSRGRGAPVRGLLRAYSRELRRVLARRTSPRRGAPLGPGGRQGDTGLGPRERRVPRPGAPSRRWGGTAGGVSGLAFLDDGLIVTSSLTSGVLSFDLLHIRGPERDGDDRRHGQRGGPRAHRAGLRWRAASLLQPGRQPAASGLLARRSVCAQSRTRSPRPAGSSSPDPSRAGRSCRRGEGGQRSARSRDEARCSGRIQRTVVRPTSWRVSTPRLTTRSSRGA